MFDKGIYTERRNKLKQRMQSGLLLFLGNNESPMNYPDNTYHFRQDSSFLYYFGLDFPGLAAIVDVDEDRAIIFGNDLTVDEIVWMGTQPTLKERALEAGITDTRPLKELDTMLANARSTGRPILYLPPYRHRNILELHRLLDKSPADIQTGSSVEFVRAVVDQRNIKGPEEIEELEKAVNITVDMHLAAMRMIKPGITEAQVAAAVTEVALAADGNVSFPVIATINGQTLHNHYHGNTLKSGDLFLLDAGAETTMRYAGDMSSTIPVDPTFTQRQKEIYTIAYDAHMAAVNLLQPGRKFKEIHLAACRVIAQGMKDLGFMTGDVDEAVAAGAHALFFPCGLGHMMGLDVHDMEDLGEVYVGYDGQPKSTEFGLKSLRLARALEPGFVLTIEPGIYFIPELIDLWKQEGRLSQFINYDKVETYKDFGGIRNEEDFVITENGYRLLGKPLPKSISEVETEKTRTLVHHPEEE
jgi:Xaa-Pro aminopeptidase